MKTTKYMLLVWGNYPMHVCDRHRDAAVIEFAQEPDATLPPEDAICAYCEGEAHDPRETQRDTRVGKGE